MNIDGPVLRLFEVRTKEGRANELIRKFATTSADVVRDEPGSMGYFYGRIIEDDDNVVVFASVWNDMKAVKARFGDDWRNAYLPPGYEGLIDECSVRHFDLSSGWHIRGQTSL